MPFFKKYHLEIYLFFVEAVCMALELCASRTLSPYFGDSNLVWTGIIGVILLSGSIGNALGGRLADKLHGGRLGKVTLLAAGLILYIPVFSSAVLAVVSSVISNREAGVLIGTILLFLPSSLAFGTIPPQVMKLRVTNLADAGKTTGRLQAVSAIGSIFGTFLSGFFLVPNFGSQNILFGLAAGTALLAFLPGGGKPKKYAPLLTVMAIACWVAVSGYYERAGAAVLSGQQGVSVKHDTMYSHVTITNGEENEEPVRYMLIGDGCGSATYIAKDMRNELVLPYTRYYSLMFQGQTDIQDVLMIGGGGYSYPKYCVSHYDGITMDVVEIDGQITELAKEYFFLDEALEEADGRLNLIQEDGKVYIIDSEKKYDAILNDAFSSLTPVESLSTLESVQQIHDMLNPGGVYLSNVIGSRQGEGSSFLLAETKTVSQVFRYVYLVPCADYGQEISATEIENHMLVASDSPLDIEGAVQVDISSAITLTDDYCPVDSLIPREF